MPVEVYGPQERRWQIRGRYRLPIGTDRIGGQADVPETPASNLSGQLLIARKTLMKRLMLGMMIVLVRTQRPAVVTGTWRWEGSAGWQRNQLNLRAEGSRLTGVIQMGPQSEEADRSGFWACFFDPVGFEI